MKKIATPLLLGALVSVIPTAGHPAEPALTVVSSRVEKVLVYGDQATVFREAWVKLGGAPLEVSVADLPLTVLPDTVKVECKSAEVKRVVILKSRAQLPVQVRARELLAQLEALHQRITALRSERQILQQEQRLIHALQLRTLPPLKEGRPVLEEGIFVDTWRRILGWMEERSLKIHARLAVLAAEEKKLRVALHPLEVEAQGLDLQAPGEPVSRVVVALQGTAGSHRVTVSYLVSDVSWRPTYDLNYDHRDKTVQATYYAVVEQRSGEDWSEARLRFSTAQPTHLIAIPELPTWTLGLAEDFVPTPRQRPEPRPVPWIPPAPAPRRDLVLEQLRQLLAGSQEASGEDAGLLPPAEQPSDSLEPSDDQAPGGVEDRQLSRGHRAPPPPPMAPAPSSVNRPQAMPTSPVLSGEVEADMGEEDSLVHSHSVPSERSTGWFGSAKKEPPQKAIPWTETGYKPPYIHPDSPAAGAKGYRFTLYAPGRHTVDTGKGKARIPLLRRVFSVRPVFHIRPGLSDTAYLVAEVKNNTGKPILRGPANLFAGAMYSGRTWINTSLPGQSIDLPLGVDDAIKVVRHLSQKTVSQGMVLKDDLTAYTVRLEVANHRRYAIAAVVEDQVPLPRKRGDDDLEIQGYSSSSFGTPDHRGLITWKGSIAPGSVKKLSFSFTIKRPKDWELRQHD